MGSSLARMGRYGRAAVRWGRLVTTAGAHRRSGLRVFYGHDRVPGPGDAVTGGSAKIQRLAERFPNHPTGFTHLYLGSNWTPRDLRPLVGLARRRGIPVIVNQDGVGYPGWAGDATETVNRPLRMLLAAADHVVYQSAFCKRSADLFLGAPGGSWEILSNAVDVGRFRPTDEPPPAGPVLLLGGDQSQAYRLELGIATLAAVLSEEPDARLLVTGVLAAPLEPIVERFGVGDRVQALGRYTQAQAPGIYGRAHVLLHTKVNDPCPNVVLEAMASGLPVVYPRSGGVPELVGTDAGVGVEHPDGFDRDEPPSPEALAAGVTTVLADLPTFRAAARRRAVERFALEPWLDRHAELFARLAPRYPATRPRQDAA